MRRLTLIAVLALTATAGACAPKPIVARDPVPAPPPGVGYACDSRPLVLNAFRTDCTPIQPEVAIRARG